MALQRGSFWAKGLFLLGVGGIASWVITGASRWSALLVMGGGLATIAAGCLIVADVRGAGAVWYRDYVRYRRWPYRYRYWENPRRNYRWSGAVSALLGLTMIAIGFLRFVESR